MRKYTYKKDGTVIDSTPESERKLSAELERDAKRIRRGMRPRGVQRGAKYPIMSEAMGIEVEDIPKAQEILRSKGVSTDYTDTGEPIIRSANHLREHAQAMGFYDRNGTWSPKNR